MRTALDTNILSLFWSGGHWQPRLPPAYQRRAPRGRTSLRRTFGHSHRRCAARWEIARGDEHHDRFRSWRRCLAIRCIKLRSLCHPSSPFRRRLSKTLAARLRNRLACVAESRPANDPGHQSLCSGFSQPSSRMTPSRNQQQLPRSLPSFQIAMRALCLGQRISILDAQLELSRSHHAKHRA